MFKECCTFVYVISHFLLIIYKRILRNILSFSEITKEEIYIMKKWLKKLLLIGIGLVTIASFSACEDDDADYSQYKSLLIGSWKVDSEDVYSVATFKQDGTGTSYNYDYVYDEVEESEFTWHLSDNKLHVKIDGQESISTIKKLTQTELIMTTDGITITAHRVIPE